MELNDITYEIRGAAFRVFGELGAGLLESIYQEAMTYELKSRGLDVKTQAAVPVIYKGHKLSSDLRLDMLVEDQVIVELKSVTELKEVYFKQLISYMKLTNKPLGYLINFNTADVSKSMYRLANDPNFKVLPRGKTYPHKKK